MEKKATIIDDHDDDVIDANTIKEEVVDVSESLANVRDAECTPVSEKVELSDAATVLILVSGLMPRTNSQFGSILGLSPSMLSYCSMYTCSTL